MAVFKNALLGLVLAATSSVFAATVPVELFSPLISSKVATTATTRNTSQYVQNTDQAGKAWQNFNANQWTSGFFPQTLYDMNERKKLCPSTINSTVDFLELGREFSAGLVQIETHNTVEHDVGFISIPFQKELLVKPNNETAITAIKAFATELAARYSSTVGCTRSWDTSDATRFQVIIDNMMNLEVLFASNDLTKNQTLVDIAKKHADTTMKNHIRPDGSCWHVVEYNGTTGAVIDKITAQGYANNSTWTRGQAWGIYGFANMFRRTSDQNYLDTSRRMATLYLNRLPSNGIVPWDFDAPAPAPADTSAATIAANALLLLAQQESSISNTTGAQHWSDAAINLLSTTLQFAWQPSWVSLLSNGTINKPANNFDTGIVYGDAYLIEAGNQLVKMGLASC